MMRPEQHEDATPSAVLCERIDSFFGHNKHKNTDHVSLVYPPVTKVKNFQRIAHFAQSGL